MSHPSPARSAADRLAIPVILTAVLTMAAPASAAAQQVSGGATVDLAALFVRGVDTAADASGNYLAIGGQGQIVAVCINAGGAAITGAMTINATGGYASFPRAVYSPHANNGAGAFLVVWAEAPGNPDAMRQLFARVVSCSAGLVGPARVVSSAVWWEPGNLGIAYSRSSGVAFVAWQTPEHTVGGSLIDNNGAPVGPIVGLSSGMGRDPSVTWNHTTNQFGGGVQRRDLFGVCRRESSQPGRIHSQYLQRVARHADDDDGRGVSLGNRPLHHVLVRAIERGARTRCRIRRQRESHLPGNGLDASGIVHDAFSMAFNPVTGTFVMVGANRDNDTVMGLELNSRGFPFNGENTLSSARPTRYPRISSSRTARNFNVVFSGPNFGSLGSLIATSFASVADLPELTVAVLHRRPAIRRHRAEAARPCSPVPAGSA